MSTNTTLKPELHTVRIEIVGDDAPDLSHLGNAENYAGVPAAELALYLAQDAERLAAYERQEWWMIGIRAVAVLRFATPVGGWLGEFQVATPGLWGIESDSGRDYLEEVASEQLEELREMLAALHIAPDVVAERFARVKI